MGSPKGPSRRPDAIATAHTLSDLVMLRVEEPDLTMSEATIPSLPFMKTDRDYQKRQPQKPTKLGDQSGTFLGIHLSLHSPHCDDRMLRFQNPEFPKSFQPQPRRSGWRESIPWAGDLPVQGIQIISTALSTNNPTSPQT